MAEVKILCPHCRRYFTRVMASLHDTDLYECDYCHKILKITIK